MEVNEGEEEIEEDEVNNMKARRKFTEDEEEIKESMQSSPSMRKK